MRFADTAGVWRFLRRISYSHHRPGCRATRRKEQAVAEWIEVTWPSIIARARLERSWIVFESESGEMLSLPVRGTWARLGQRVWLRCSYACQYKVSWSCSSAIDLGDGSTKAVLLPNLECFVH